MVTEFPEIKLPFQTLGTFTNFIENTDRNNIMPLFYQFFAIYILAKLDHDLFNLKVDCITKLIGHCDDCADRCLMSQKIIELWRFCLLGYFKFFFRNFSSQFSGLFSPTLNSQTHEFRHFLFFLIILFTPTCTIYSPASKHSACLMTNFFAIIISMS